MNLQHTGRQTGERIAEFEDLLDHHRDGIWWCHRSPLVKDDRATESSVMILIGTNNMSRRPESAKAKWESRLVCLLTAIWQILQCTVLTICTIPMDTRLHLAATRRLNERTVNLNNIVRNLASCNAEILVLMVLEYELRALSQTRFTVNAVHFNTTEGQAWMTREFQERLDELEVELLDTGVLSADAAADVRAISTFIHPSLETRLRSVPAVSQTVRSSRDPEARSDEIERLGESPARRTMHPRRRLGPVNQIDAPGPSHAGAPARRAERHIGRGPLMWTRPRPSPWHV